jgi:hypothetical protein
MKLKKNIKINTNSNQNNESQNPNEYKLRTNLDFGSLGANP